MQWIDLEFNSGVSIPDKEYFRIGEVSKILGVAPYVVRYWESEFKSVRPERTRSDQRLYRRKDLRQLLLIKHLLYIEGFTVNGAKRQLMKMKNAPPETDKGQNRARLEEIKKGLCLIREIIR
ncbi:MAG: MerR family transcriptional regulator [Deltaproteobacteria bacterium]|nr:MerR family transcriptional regulator [Deltaproteobacteria bacterium]